MYISPSAPSPPPLSLAAEKCVCVGEGGGGGRAGKKKMVGPVEQTHLTQKDVFRFSSTLLAVEDKYSVTKSTRQSVKRAKAVDKVGTS